MTLIVFRIQPVTSSSLNPAQETLHTKQTFADALPGRKYMILSDSDCAMISRQHEH